MIVVVALARAFTVAAQAVFVVVRSQAIYPHACVRVRACVKLIYSIFMTRVH